MALVVLAAGIILIKILTHVLRTFLKDKNVLTFFKNFGFDENIAEIIVSFFRYFAYAIVALIAIAQFGFMVLIFELIVIIIIFVVVIILAFSLKDFMSNAGAGLYLARNKMIKKGDIIKINGQKGTVTKIDLISITIVDRDKTMIVPNSKIIDRIITKVKKG